MDQKATYMIMIKNIDRLLVTSNKETGYLEQARKWLFNQLEQYNK